MALNATAFMAVTAHYIDDDFKMHDLTIAVLRVQGNSFLPFLLCYINFLTLFCLYWSGSHNGKKFAKLFYNVLAQYNTLDCLHTITTDNTSVNHKMACELDLEIPNLKSSTQILGCIAHVINLGTKIGISALDSVDDNHHGEEISMADSETTANPINISSCDLATWWSQN